MAYFIRVAIAAWAIVPSANAQVVPVLITGDAAPGVPGAVVASIHEKPGPFNNVGQSALDIRLAIGPGGVGIGNDQVIYRFTPGVGFDLVARGLDPIPALPGDNYDGNSPLFGGNRSMNGAGDIAFVGGFSGARRGLFINGTSEVIRSGIQAPGLAPGVTTSVLHFDTQINDSNAVLHTMVVTGSGVDLTSNTVLYRNTDVIFREGSTAPFTGSTFGDISSLNDVRMNNAGDVAFTNDLQTGDAANNGSIWKHSGGVLTPLARDGDAAPMTAGLTFGHLGFNSPRINASGQVAYHGESTTGVDMLYVDTTLFAIDGQAAPSLPGLTFNGISSRWLDLNDSGDLMFGTLLTGPGVDANNSQALYLNSTLLARRGNASPLVGTTFRDLSMLSFDLNNHGEAIFGAFLEGTGVSSANDFVLLGWNGSSLSVILREGDALAGSSLQSILGTGGINASLNDAGQILFWAELADGREGVFMTMIPAPGALGLLALGAGVAVRRRTR
jgi:hypothetical protein